MKAYLKLSKGAGKQDCLFENDELNKYEKGETVGQRHQRLKRKWKLNFEKHKRKPRRLVFAGKSDLKSAFRILGLSPRCWKWLVMKARDPSTGEWRYFIDKCLPFGASISCAWFQRFSDALCHIVTYQAGPGKEITNYLDDFLFLALSLGLCDLTIKQFLDTCNELNIPVALDKTEYSLETVVFLGILELISYWQYHWIRRTR